MFRVIRETHPAWVVGENVANLTNFLEFENALLDLESEGYEVQAFIIPASAVGAWHQRKRVWIVAKNANYIRCNGSVRKEKPKDGGFGEFSTRNLQRVYRKQDVRYTKSQRLQGLPVRKMEKSEEFAQGCKNDTDTNDPGCKEQREQNPNGKEQQTFECGNWWQTEPNVGRVVTRFSSTLDETLNDIRYGCEIKYDKKAISKVDFTRRRIMRYMWSKGQKVEPPPYKNGKGQSNDSMYEMSCFIAHERWKLGKRIENDKELRYLWKLIYSKPFKETQNLQQKMLERIRENERNEKVESKSSDRLKALGNAIVPQVAFEIFKAIEQTYT